MSPPAEHLRDPLTGIWNRALIPIRLQEAIVAAQHDGGAFSIMMIDVDHFKSINDAFGHSRGDQILVAFARFLQESTRETDTVFRYGGDEFIILLGDAGQDQARTFADRLLKILAQTQFSGSPQVTLSASAGVVTFPIDATSAESLFDLADQRHYAAKLAGRGRFMAQDPEVQSGLVFDSQSRLIDRDAALNDTHALFDELPAKASAALKIEGADDSGKSRFMMEVAKIGRLRGYMVLHVAGSYALQAREYGALLTAQAKWEGLTLARPDVDIFRDEIAQALSDKGQSGLVITVNQSAQLDPATRRLLQSLLLHKLPFQCVLAFTTNLDDVSWELEAEFTRSIQIHAFDATGVKIWVRQVMNWEAPPAFTAWLFKESRGLPGKLRALVRSLIDQGHIYRSNAGWEFDMAILDTPFNTSTALDFDASMGRAGNLPKDMDLLIGRNQEVDQIKASLKRSRLVTLSGQGGIGKSRLAIQPAAETAGHFTDGVYLVRLGPIRNAIEPARQIEAVANAIAIEWDLPSSTDIDIKTQVIDHLRSRSTLLILDNFEHLPAAAELVTELYSATRDVHMLITSREILHLPEEAVVNIKGLAVPDEQEIADLDIDQNIEDYPSIRMFLHYARKLNPDFVPTPADWMSISHICQLVGGLPLGIRLSASWMSVSPPHEISQQLENNLDVLALQRPVQTERQRRFEAVFEYFWNLLSDSEQQVLCRLSVFQGPFNREAAFQIAGASPFFLSALVDRSFLQVDGSGRFELHELLRQFAGRNLDTYRDEPETVKQIHANYFLGLLNSAVG